MSITTESLSEPASSDDISERYQKILKYRYLVMALLIALISGSLVLDFMIGPSGLSIKEFFTALTNPDATNIATRVIVWDIRLPYALMAVVVGMGLGLAGAEMQTILNNPLASPFTLGISSAAAFGAALAIIVGVGVPGIPTQLLVPVNAFIFALLATALLDGIARWTRVSTSGVVLFGIALVFTFNALVSVMQFIASEDTLQGLVFWTMGSLVRASWGKLGVMALILLIIFPLSMNSAWKLTALRLGEDRATSFGINVRSLRMASLLRISIISAIAVAFVGPIGFIGLVAPHISRLVFGEDHRFYLTGSMLTGALVLSLSSVVSKNIIPGVILPVGIVTSLIGVPFFLSIILRHRRSL